MFTENVQSMNREGLLEQLAPTKIYFKVKGFLKNFKNENNGATFYSKKNANYVYAKLQFGVQLFGSDTVIHFNTMSGMDTSKPVFLNTRKGEKGTFSITEIQNKAVIEQVAHYYYKTINDYNTDEEQTFLNEYFLLKYMYEHLQDDMPVSISGEMSVKVWEGQQYNEYRISRIGILTNDEQSIKQYNENTSRMELNYRNLLIDQDSLSIDTIDWAKASTVSGKAMFLKRVKADEYELYDIPFTYSLSADNEKKRKERIMRLTHFMGYKKASDNASEKSKLNCILNGKILSISAVGYYYEGTSKNNDGAEDVFITDELQSLIDVGIYTKEDIIAMSDNYNRYSFIKEYGISDFLIMGADNTMTYKMVFIDVPAEWKTMITEKPSATDDATLNSILMGAEPADDDDLPF